MHEMPRVPPHAAELAPLHAVPARETMVRRLTALLFVVAFAGLALPVWLVDVPPLLDYPNHLVRLWLIAGGAQIAPLSKMYAVSWGSAHTNVGIDYLGALSANIVP